MAVLGIQARRVSAAAVLFGAALLCGCAAIKNVDEPEDRAVLVNKSVAEYTNKAILLNILRSRDRAPLSFTALSQVQGHNNLSGSVGVPSITFGPHLRSNPRTFTIGPNTVSRQFNSDFTLNVVDDPNTYSALFSPIAPATIGLFASQGYPREIILLLFVDRIQVRPGAGSPWTTYKNEPSQPSYPAFVKLLYTLIDGGLTVETVSSRSRLPDGASEQKLVSGRVCMDSSYAAEHTDAIESYVNKSVTSSMEGMASKNDEKGRTVLKGLLARITDVENSVKRFDGLEKVGKLGSYGISCGDNDDEPHVADPHSSAAIASESRRNDTLVFDDSAQVRLVFRSAYGAYWFLGGLTGGMNNTEYLIPTFTFQSPGDKLDLMETRRIDEDLESPHVYSNALFQLVGDSHRSGSGSCFVRTTYGGGHWCIDEHSKSSKMIFAMIHQLVQLYSNPSSQSPSTISARIQS